MQQNIVADSIYDGKGRIDNMATKKSFDILRDKSLKQVHFYNSGIRMPDISVPLGTYTGWNFRNPSTGSPAELVSLLGSSTYFPATRAVRDAAKDPRRSVEERYPSREAYLAQGGKEGKIRVLSVARMHGTSAHKGGELQVVPTPSGTDLFTAPAVWHPSSGTWMFAADNGGTAAYRFRDGRLSVAWRSGTGGTSPVVAGGLLWVYAPGGGLNVYVPSSGRLVATTMDWSLALPWKPAMRGASERRIAPPRGLSGSDDMTS